MIELKNIKKIYNQGKENQVNALMDISLEIKAGESLAIMGVSGSGKTTLLNIIGCLDKATEGSYLFKGKDMSKMTDKDIAQVRGTEVGFVLQNYALITSEKVKSNLEIPLYFTNRNNYNKKSRIAEVLKSLNIYELLNRKVSQLSGGQKQRVAIARALINNPSIILADEPTGALDSNTANEIMEIFKELQSKGKSIITVTHDKNVAEKMDKILYIKDGKFVQDTL